MEYCVLSNLDRYFRLNPEENYFDFFPNSSFTSRLLKIKRMLSFLLKKWSLFYHYDEESIYLNCLNIMKFLFSHLNK